MSPMEPPFHYLPSDYWIRHATESWERAGCAALRRAVFCGEQQLFDGDDRDALDDIALTIAAIAGCAGMPEQVVGTVRIHNAGDGIWQGSRLAVRADYRASAWLGSELIRHAVSTAHARGCRRFLAQVQQQNVRLFERLHWRALAAIEVRGRPHALMQADLTHYPPRHADEVRFVSSLRRAA